MTLWQRRLRQHMETPHCNRSAAAPLPTGVGRSLLPPSPSSGMEEKTTEDWQRLHEINKQLFEDQALLHKELEVQQERVHRQEMRLHKLEFALNGNGVNPGVHAADAGGRSLPNKEGSALQSQGDSEVLKHMKHDMAQFREELIEEMLKWLDEELRSRGEDLRSELHAKLAQHMEEVRSQYVHDKQTFLHAQEEAARDAGNAGQISKQVHGESGDEKTEISMTKSVLHMSDVKQKVIEDTQLDKLQPTVWDAAMFVGYANLGLLDNVLLVFSLITNIVMQLLFAVVVTRTFPTSLIEIDSMEQWRQSVGHRAINVDLDGHSLVSRVCENHISLSFANYQANLLEAADIYSKSFDGAALCMLVIIIWFLVILDDYERAVLLVRELFHIPNSSQTVVSESEDGKWHLSGLYKGHKVFMFCVGMSRVTVGALLLYKGTQWLTSTPSIQELVLNGAALAFVFNIDEFLFEIFVPKLVKILIERLTFRSVHMYGFKRCKCPRALVHVSAVVTFAIVMLFVVILPNAAHMGDLYDAACGGDRDFAVGYNRDMDMHFYTSTAAASSYRPSSAIGWKAVDNLIDGRKVDFVRRVPDIKTLEGLLMTTANDMADSFNPSCSDRTPPDLQEFWQTMKKALNISEAKSCEDVSWACANPSVHLIRMLCPETCRCLKPKPSMAVSKGCPYEPCLDIATSMHYDEEADCMDDEPSSLITNPHWRGYWESLNASTILSSLFDSKVVEFALKSGCSVITEYDLKQEVCADHPNRHSLGTFCPEACDCEYADLWGCPAHCFV